MVMLLAALTGCNKGTPGGPGATDPDTKKQTINLGQSDDTFTLSVPSSLPLLSTKVTQGETAKLTIGINRGKSFQQDVALKFEGLPTGVMIDQTAGIKSSETEVNLTITATDSASVGEAEIKVIGHPTSGGDASNKFKLTVEKKDVSAATFTLGVPSSLPLLATKVQQGGTTKVVITIKRGKNFNQDVGLKFEGMPNGVTIDPAGAKILQGQSEANLTLAAKDDASLGDFDIKVVAHPATGDDASSTFKITVTKK